MATVRGLVKVRIPSKLITLALAAALPGCAGYQDRWPGYAATSTVDRAWTAALGALEEVGVQVTSSERSTGQIRGTRNGMNVAVSVIRRADGRTRVQFAVKEAKERDPELPGRFLEAYERRMDR